MEQHELTDEELWNVIQIATGSEKAESFFELGRRAYEKGDPKSSLAFCEVALQEARSLEYGFESYLTGSILLGLSYSLRELQRHEEAAFAAEEAADKLGSHGDAERVHALINAGHFWYTAEKWSNSISCYGKAIAEINHDTDPELLSEVQAHHGFSLMQMSLWSQAIESFSSSLAFHSKSLNLAGMAQCEHEISHAYGKLNDWGSSFAHATSSLKHATQASNLTRIAWARLRLGQALKGLGKNEDALAQFTRAKTLMAESKCIGFLEMVRCDEEIIELLVVLNRADEANEIQRRLISVREILCDD